MNSPLITTEIVVAYSHCPRKAFLLLFSKEEGHSHEYLQLIEQEKVRNREKFIDSLQQRLFSVENPCTGNIEQDHNFLIDTTLRSNDLEAYCDILTKVAGTSSFGAYVYEPTIFTGLYKSSREKELELFYIGHVLEKIQGKLPTSGTVIDMGGVSHKIKLEGSTNSLNQILEPLREWIVSQPQEPSVVLNKHCPYCQFRYLCKYKAEQEDHISLLDSITPKMVRRYERKGIFTVKQLSYLFKPRKHKGGSNRSAIIRKPELQALAIRTGKIYLQELPQISRQQVEIFIDIEGIPDQQIYYLIGLLICTSESIEYYSFWADTQKDEELVWKQFLEKVNEYPGAPIYHYGSYDSKALIKLSNRYNYGRVNEALLINVSKYIYGKIYFPVRSNSLKDIGKFIEASWTSDNASGLQSLVWRHHWESQQDPQHKELLITYNKEDCMAVRGLVDELDKIKLSARVLNGVDFVDEPKHHMTMNGEEVHSQFKTILEFAHANYDDKKIKFSISREDTTETEKVDTEEWIGSKSGYQGQRKVRPKATKTIHVKQEKYCPKHKNVQLRLTERTAKRLIIDLVLTEFGLRKIITEYLGFQSYCPSCHRYHNPPDIRKFQVNQLYGHGFKSWIVYQRVALRMSYGSIAEALEEQFDEKDPRKSTSAFIKDFGRYYAGTEKIILQLLLESPFIHVDETPINIRGAGQYVWVFTDGKYVIFKLRRTREATIIHEFFADYEGVVISDFYPGYDSVKCRQQKCWVHLIRDLNDDLRMSPFNTEFDMFVLEVRNLIVPIMEMVQRYGLKAQYLSNFKTEVDKFYETTIYNRNYESDITLKYRERFKRYRNSLFTFLDQDNIPWHNNTAERAIRHVAMQNEISGFLHESVTHDYLLLLGIRQACRFQGKSFLKFLFSKEKDFRRF